MKLECEGQHEGKSDSNEILGRSVSKVAKVSITSAILRLRQFDVFAAGSFVWADASLEPNISELEADISPRSRLHSRFATAHVLAGTSFHRAVFRVDVVVFRVYRPAKEAFVLVILPTGECCYIFDTKQKQGDH